MIISKTPLRMSFAGGGSDLEDYYKQGSGSVVSTTIDKFIYVTVNDKFDPHIRVSYSKTEWVKNINEIEHDLIREALKVTKIKKSKEKGLDIVYMSDMLPEHAGSGLGASSSLCVGILNALYAYKGKDVCAERLAREACKIEIEILGHPIGKQDQYAAAYGGLNFIQFNSNEKVNVDPIILNDEIKKRLNKNLILFYTNLKKRSDEILNEQKKKTRKNLKNLDKIVELSKELNRSLEKGDLKRFGNILDEGWGYKKTLASKITNPIIEDYYKKARNNGALGGKILGSGGGGFLLFYCDPDKQNKVKKALSNLREAKFKFEELGSRIIYRE